VEKFFQLLVSGVARGGIYAMAALGFVLIFKATRVINFAQGALMMLGGYVGFAVAATWGLPIVIAFALGGLAVAVVGGFMYWSSLAPLESSDTNTEFAQVIITMGWSILIAAVVQYIWGPISRRFPTIFPSGTFQIHGVRIAYIDVGTIGITLAVVLACSLIFQFTRYGLVMRGIADNRQSAVMMGADERRANIGAWALAAGVAAIAGITLSSYTPLGLTYPDVAMMAFPAVVLGGIDSIPGGLVGGILIGVIQQMAGGYIDPAFGTTAGFILMLVVLLVRPNGLLGSPEAVRL
jgi:branched-chain amino acid transport system permease protein